MALSSLSFSPKQIPFNEKDSNMVENAAALSKIGKRNGMWIEVFIEVSRRVRKEGSWYKKVNLSHIVRRLKFPNTLLHASNCISILYVAVHWKCFVCRFRMAWDMKTLRHSYDTLQCEYTKLPMTQTKIDFLSLCLSLLLSDCVQRLRPAKAVVYNSIWMVGN